MWTTAICFGSGADTSYLLFDEVRGYHVHDYPYHDEDPVDPPDWAKVE